MDPAAADPQVTGAVSALRAALGGDLVAVYLFGSAVGPGLRPSSDLDLMAVARRATGSHEKRALVDALLGISGCPRPLEVTVVVASDVRPWSYPPRMDFQYGEWWRNELESGELEPWDSPVNPDLASLIHMVVDGGVPLFGPPPSELFDPVPRADYVKASLAGIDALLEDLEWDTRNVVLTFARMWVTLATGAVCSKDAAADWALRVLPSRHHRVVAEARDIYCGRREAWPEPPVEEARAFALYAVSQIRESAERGGSAGVARSDA